MQRKNISSSDDNLIRFLRMKDINDVVDEDSHIFKNLKYTQDFSKNSRKNNIKSYKGKQINLNVTFSKYNKCFPSTEC